MSKDIFYCKKDVWWNIVYDDLERLALKSSYLSESRELSFVKAHDKSILVFEKGKKYQVDSRGSDGIYMKSDNSRYLFVYYTNDSLLYFNSVFLPLKFERKIKIKKFLRDNK